MKRNKDLAQHFSNMKCDICGSNQGVSGHHLITFGSRPDLDISQNMKALCFEHHREIHDIGLKDFVSNYGLFKEMYDRGFAFNGMFNKWFFDDAEKFKGPYHFTIFDNEPNVGEGGL